MHLETILSPLGHKGNFILKESVMSYFKTALRICYVYKEGKLGYFHYLGCFPRSYHRPRALLKTEGVFVIFFLKLNKILFK